AVAEQPGVEEVRRQAAGLRAEFAEAQYAALDGEADKLRAQIVCHVRNHREKERVGAMIRVVTLNLNGIRSAARRGWVEWANAQGADVACVQAVRAPEGDLGAATHAAGGVHAHFDCGRRKGYSGVGGFARRRPRGVRSGFGRAEFDAEGRYLELDFGSYAVVSVYVPSGSSSPERQAAKFRFLAEFQRHLRALRASGREVILCGDWNIAHKEIDLKNWRSNQKNSGFLPEERAWLTELFDEVR